jgi:hypothetical protein
MSVIHVLPILININDKKRRNTLIKRSKTLRNGQERSGTVKNAQERSRTLRNGQERSRTFKNGQERSRTVRNGERSGTVNGQERWTVRNGERSGTVNGQGRWTVCNDHTVQGKRSETIAKSRSRYVHGTFTFTFQKRKKHCTINIFKELLKF